jgi:hypothetical protein
MALNGAYDVLFDAGILPDYFAMLDARSANVNFLSRANFATTYLLASQVHPDCYAALLGCDVRTFHLHTPTTKLVFPDEPVYYGGGTTIGLTAMGLAAGMGYRKLLLIGYDSSFEGEAQHAKHQPQNDTDTRIDVWAHGRRYWSTGNMAQQVMDFRPWVKALEATFPGLEITLAGRGLLYDQIITAQSLPPATREEEAAKYEAAYAMSDYGMTPEREHGVKVLLAALPPDTAESLLDVGTGRGETLKLAREMAFAKADGTETVEALLGPNVIKALLPEIPLPDKSYDVVTCFEVVEHLLPDDVRPALVELGRLARHHLIVSACTQDHWVAGTNLHPSAKPLEEWEALFRSIWGDKARLVGNLSELGISPVWRVDL